MSHFESYCSKVWTIVWIEVRKLRRDPTDLFSRAVQPALWLLIFGQVFSRSRLVDTGSVPYLDFMAPGILAQSVLFIAIFYGLSAIWERDLGILQKQLVSPTPRTALVAGKALASGIRGLVQGAFVYILSFALGVHLSTNPFGFLVALLAIILGAALFSTFSLIIACIVKSRERFMGIGQVLTMPLFFASDAIYPIKMMPNWLQVVSHVNPLTYEVDLLRSAMLPGALVASQAGIDIAVLTGVTIVLIGIAAKMYPGLAK